MHTQTGLASLFSDVGLFVTAQLCVCDQKVQELAWVCLCVVVLECVGVCVWWVCVCLFW